MIAERNKEENKMKLVREIGNFQKLHLGPYPNGTFWAAKDANDLPHQGTVLEVELSELLAKGQLWVQNAHKPGTWERVYQLPDVPVFTVSWHDDYEAVTTYKRFHPFLPEFYFVPEDGYTFCQFCYQVVQTDDDGAFPICTNCWNRV